MQQNQFVVYNASAGSGKTFTLVKSYLETLFSSSDKDKFKHVLAITFTNKAVAEMKERILKNLKAYASPRILSNSEAFADEYKMFSDICENLGFTENQLHEKAIVVQDAILNNYAAFDIVTIDTFTHRIIRTFAYDLKLSQNFEVALDTQEVLQEAVNNVVARVGEDAQLTKLLIDFAMQKADDDKSWDISLDLFKISKILLNEEGIQHVESLKEKTFDDFKNVRKKIKDKIQEANQKAIEIAKNRISIFDKNGILLSEIKSVYQYFEKIKGDDFAVKFDLVWQKKLIEGLVIYKKNSPSASLIDTMQKDITADFIETKHLYYKISFLKNFQKNMTPLSVINEVQKEMNLLKEEQNILLISEFNSIIANEIKGQPAPFIYERIGERYQNYFIDEFQDTSQLQWENIIPLTENALVTAPKKGESNSVMLVGDAKQSIYRFRGGKAEQFINLYADESKSPFYLPPIVKNLDTNWRSYSEVVQFNNNFFTHLISRFSDQAHQNLYKIGNQQKANAKKGGYVEISFVEKSTAAETSILYQEKVKDIIQKVTNDGFELADICVITRTRKDGVAIADYLTEEKINIVSSETLLINKSAAVQFIVSFLKFLQNSGDKTAKIEILFFLYHHLEVSGSENQFYTRLVGCSQSEFFKTIALNNQIQFDYTLAETLPFYELVEYVVSAFRLVKKSDAYVQYFLDEVLQFTQKKSTGIAGFLEHWEGKKDKLSIVAPEGNNAVTLMTIHKSKGLEFPIVIFPYADMDIYNQIDPKIWFPITGETYCGFNEAYLNYNKDVEKYGDIGEVMYLQKQSELELDNINLLYVVLTRAKEQLYVISKLELNKDGDENLKKYSGFFIDYLRTIGKWDDNEVVYSFGEDVKKSKKTDIKKVAVIPFISSSRIDHNLSIMTKSGYLWDTHQQKAIEKGNLIHLLMSKIKYQRDVDMAFSEMKEAGVLTEKQEIALKPIVLQLVLTSDIANFFTEEYTIYNERVILDKNGNQIIPDRVAIKNNKAIIIDYKTGVGEDKHHHQLQKYAIALSDMGFEVTQKILVYLNEEISIEKVK